jgi:S-(hydroxymethyl)glutathione dehydrogenase/alcohol dehydrogenase
VGTGWGSAVNAAEVEPGHTVVVMGIGGIGINAVQGALHAGATPVIAVDPCAVQT